MSGGHPPGRGRIQITDKIKVDIEQKEGQTVKVDLQRNPKKFYQQFTFWFSAASLTISISDNSSCKQSTERR